MKNNNELLKLTADLIGFITVNENKNEIRKCLDYIKEYFKSSDFIIKEFDNKGIISLVISFNDKKHYSLILNGHIDVVHAEPDQFAAKVKDDKIFGRGAIDMKSGVAAFMLLMKGFSKLKKKPDVALMIVSDEEMGGFNGTGHLVNDIGYTADFVIASEPTHVDDMNNLNIIDAEKGVLWLKVSTEGRSCHASRPWLGDNAIEKLMQKFYEIKKLFPKTTEKDRWHTTVNLSKIIAGDSINRVPDKAEMYLDIRYTEETSIPKLLKKIGTIKGIKVEPLERSPMLLNMKNDKILLLKKTAAKFCRKCALLKEHGASDLRFFSEKGIQTAIFGPHGENYHGKDEFVYIKSLEKYYAVMKAFVEDYY